MEYQVSQVRFRIPAKLELLNNITHQNLNIMKKTLIALTVLLSSAMIATAQQKSPEALRSAVDKA